MKCKYSITIWLFLAVLLLVACDNGERQRLQLAELERQNRADSLMLNDSLARDLADWFDRHGTRNEQMRAHYILGRTYADRGESPAALDAYNDAADRADTTSKDCDYYTLCRVYTQMAHVFFLQNLYYEDLASLDRAIKYAFMARDTLSAFLAYAQKTDAYDMLVMPDSCLSVSERAFSLLNDAGCTDFAASMLISAIVPLSDKGDFSKTRHYIDIYENYSGYFDDEKNIKPGREIYYYNKGYYFLKSCQYDSAEYYFRKELITGSDYNNQNAGSRGLALLFQQTNKPDSAAKYALYAYAMNDSVYDNEATAEVAKMKSLYVYSRYQQQAEREKSRTEKERMKNGILLFISVIICLLFILFIIYQRKRHRKRYQEIVGKLVQAQNDILRLQSHDHTLAEMIDMQANATISNDEVLTPNSLTLERDQLRQSIIEKENEIKELETLLAGFRHFRQSAADVINKRINQSDIYQCVRNKANIGEELSISDWNQLMQLIIQNLPNFYTLISSRERSLSKLEYQICILDRLGIEPGRICYLIGISESYVSRIRSTLHQKLFDVDASRKEFSQKIRTIY